jgi:nascent polypeptide-associated complex subunit alpha
MLDRMGFDMKEVTNVQEVIIKTDKKEIIITKPAVTEMRSKDNSIFQVIANSYEEKELEIPVFSEEDIMLVCQQANVTPEVATNALKETGGDLARAILLLSTK